MSAPEKAGSKIVHVYDDIEEEDNHLPNWWLGILFGSIAFAFGYWFVFEVAHASPGPVAAFKTEMADLEKRRAEGAPVSNESLAVLAKDATTLTEGQKTFVATCAPCHGVEAQGLVGPNLTDKFWLHGGSPLDIHKSVTNGYPEKGMRAWMGLLGAGRVRSVAAYVVSLKGKNLPGKAPQGLPVE